MCEISDMVLEWSHYNKAEVNIWLILQKIGFSDILKTPFESKCSLLKFPETSGLLFLQQTCVLQDAEKYRNQTQEELWKRKRLNWALCRS